MKATAYQTTAIGTLLDCLNGRDNTARATAKIQELVEDWWRHGRDTRRMSSALQFELEKAASKVTLKWNANLRADSPLHGASLVRSYSQDRPHHLMDGAFVRFFELVESPPETQRALARCARKGCPLYFLRGSRLKDGKKAVRGSTSYCTPKCGRLRATKNARDRVLDEKFAKIDAAVLSLDKLKPRPRDATAWIHRKTGRTPEKRVSKAFITRHYPDL